MIIWLIWCVSPNKSTKHKKPYSHIIVVVSTILPFMLNARHDTLYSTCEHIRVIIKCLHNNMCTRSHPAINTAIVYCRKLYMWMYISVSVCLHICGESFLNWFVFRVCRFTSSHAPKNHIFTFHIHASRVFKLTLMVMIHLKYVYDMWRLYG